MSKRMGRDGPGDSVSDVNIISLSTYMAMCLVLLCLSDHHFCESSPKTNMNN